MKSLFKYKHKKIVVTLSLLIIAVFSFSSCYYDKSELLYPGSNATVDCNLVSAKFSTDISPLIQSKCASSGCHDANASGGVSLMNYTQISAAKNLINTSAVVNKNMPTSGPLSLDEVSKLKCWITAGAPNN